MRTLFIIYQIVSFIGFRGKQPPPPSTTLEGAKSQTINRVCIISNQEFLFYSSQKFSVIPEYWNKNTSQRKPLLSKNFAANSFHTKHKHSRFSKFTWIFFIYLQDIGYKPTIGSSERISKCSKTELCPPRAITSQQCPLQAGSNQQGPPRASAIQQFPSQASTITEIPDTSWFNPTVPAKSQRNINSAADSYKKKLNFFLNLGSANLTWDVFTTIVTETVFFKVRPLTHVRSDNEDEDSLTPNLFLIIWAFPYTPACVFNKNPTPKTKTWTQVRWWLEPIWRRRDREYLPIMNAHRKLTYPESEPWSQQCCLGTGGVDSERNLASRIRDTDFHLQRPTCWILWSKNSCRSYAQLWNYHMFSSKQSTQVKLGWLW